MRRPLATTAACLITMTGFAAEDYIITINGTPHDIGLDTKKEITLPGGTALNVALTMKDEVQCERPYFGFRHSSKYKANTTDLGDGIFQTLLPTPEGTIILIQEYTDMDPSSMIDLMLRELTKEEIDYGYTYAESKITRKTATLEVSGKQAITHYRDDNWVREVCAVGGKDCGLLIITAIETKSNAKEQFLIDGFWKTLQVKLPDPGRG